MRQLNPLTNLLLACLCAVGIFGSLDLPWFAMADPASGPSAQAVADGQGPMNAFASQFVRTFSSDGITTSGAEALDGVRALLLAVVALVIVVSTAMAIPALRRPLRDVLRTVGIAAPLLVAGAAITSPRAAGMEPRWGLVASVAIALFMASAAWHGSAARIPRSAGARARAAL